ncbi:MAG: sarcosine oxidase subunit gamma family protein [Acidimicrobiales bacterium]
MSIRAADDTAAAHALGLAFGSAEHRNDTLVVRIRPDEWYLLGAGARAVADELDLSGHASTVDITHARHAIRVTGTHAADTLAKLCSADFDDAMTPNGAAWGNSIAGVTCDIVRDDDGGERSYLLLFDGSFVAYFHGVLEDAAGEFSSDA